MGLGRLLTSVKPPTRKDLDAMPGIVGVPINYRLAFGANAAREALILQTVPATGRQFAWGHEYGGPGKRRCRNHGGLSTGPRTAEGRAVSLRLN